MQVLGRWQRNELVRKHWENIKNEKMTGFRIPDPQLFSTVITQHGAPLGRTLFAPLTPTAESPQLGEVGTLEVGFECACAVRSAVKSSGSEFVCGL